MKTDIKKAAPDCKESEATKRNITLYYSMIQKLKQEVQKEREYSDVWIKKYISKKIENEGLKSRSEGLEIQNDELKKRIKRLEMKNEVLEEDNRDLKNEIRWFMNKKGVECCNGKNN